MQLTQRYLVKNRTTIVLDDIGLVTEYRPVYKRNINLYKGIDNNLEFRVLNADQKPIDLSNYTSYINIFDEYQNLIIEKSGTNVAGITGVFSVTIFENELLNVRQQYLSYNIYLVDSQSNKSLTYTDTHFGNNGTMFLSSDAFPGPLSTANIDSFTQNNIDSEIYYSSSVEAQPGINGNEALHTAVFYTDNYSGDIVVQATLDNQITDGSSWADIQTLTFTGLETEPTPVNFNGVFSYLRFKATSNPTDKISKILVRN